MTTSEDIAPPPRRLRMPPNLTWKITSLLSTGFDSVDCSSGTCDGCGGVFGFDYDSAVVGTAESGGTVSLTLVRLVGTDGEVTVDLDVTGGNATEVSDFGGTWPTQVQRDCPPVRVQEAGREGLLFRL